MRKEDNIRSVFLIEFIKNILLNYNIQESAHDYPYLINYNVSPNIRRIGYETESEKDISKDMPFSSEYDLKEPIKIKVIKEITDVSEKINPPNNEEKDKLSYEEKKINEFIDDNSITLIECTGPDKPIILKNRDETFISKIVLKEEQIRNLIKRLSNQYKDNGIIKEEKQNYVLMAVMSEFAGSQFLIRKK